jgi:hypothetical protein
MLAQKFVDDVPLGNAEFVILADRALSACKSLSSSAISTPKLRFINYLEGTFLRTIHFDVFVKNKVYFEFLLELEAFQRSFQGDNSSKDPLRTIQAHLIGLDSTKNSLVFAAHQKKSSVDDEGIVKCKGRVVLS